MPTIFSHAIFAAVAGKSFINKSVSFWFWGLTALCAIIPDADAVGFVFRIPYGSMLGHRGITHSFLFAVFFGSLIAFFVHKYLKTGLSLTALTIFFSSATFSHPLLDMLTNGGLGVALLAPFSSERFFFPWRPIEVSPIGIRFFSSGGLSVILSEIIWVWLPALIIFIAAIIIKKVRKKMNS